MTQRKSHRIRLFCFILIMSAGLGLKASGQDTIVLKASEFDRLANELMTEQKLSENFRNGFDSLRTWYNELLTNYEQSQANLAACMNERTIAHNYIDTLRTNLSKAWTQKDQAEAKVLIEHNKKNKDWSVGIMPVGYDFIGRRVVLFNAGLLWSPNFARFSLRGLFDSDTKATPYNPSILSTLNH